MRESVRNTKTITQTRSLLLEISHLIVELSCLN